MPEVKRTNAASSIPGASGGWGPSSRVKRRPLPPGFSSGDGLAGLGRAAAVVENRAQGRAGQHVRQFVRLHLVMDGHDHRAAAQRRQRADDEGAPVARPHAHALPCAHAQPVKLDPQRLDFAPERLVIQRAAGINDGDAVGPLPGGLGKRFENVHRPENLFLFLVWSIRTESASFH